MLTNLGACRWVFRYVRSQVYSGEASNFWVTSASIPIQFSRLDTSKAIGPSILPKFRLYGTSELSSGLKPSQEFDDALFVSVIFAIWSCIRLVRYGELQTDVTWTYAAAVESCVDFKSRIIAILCDPYTNDDHVKSDWDNGRDLREAWIGQPNSGGDKGYTISKTISSNGSDTRQARVTTSVNEYKRPESMIIESTGRSGPLVKRTPATRRSIRQMRYTSKRVDIRFVDRVVA